MRTVVEQPSVASAVDQAADKWLRAAEAWQTVTWVLARDPEKGIPLTESGKTRMFTLHGARSIKLPTVRVVYEVQDRTLVIQEALFEEAPYSHAGRA